MKIPSQDFTKHHLQTFFFHLCYHTYLPKFHINQKKIGLTSNVRRAVALLRLGNAPLQQEQNHT